MTDQPKWEVLREAFAAYARGRQELLDAIGVTASNRDPLSEFAERLVAVLLDAEPATNRVQRGWDLVTPAGRRVQVKYLANPSEGWINGIAITFGADRDDPDDPHAFAVMFIEALLPVSVLVFGPERLGEVCAKLGKRHPNQERTLQLTEANYRRILAAPSDFAALGVTVFDLREVAEEEAETAAKGAEKA